jgi:uncharacterized protein YqeY
MALKDQIMKDLQDAMRSGDALRKDTLRLMRSAIRNAEMARGAHMLDLAALGDTESGVAALGASEKAVYSEIRQRRKLAEEYENTERLDMAAAERDAIGALVEKYAELDDKGVEDVIRKEVKQRRESVEAYEKARRMDLADKERAEAAILEVYLPQQMSEDEIEAEVRAILADTGAREMSKIMPLAMGRMKGKAEGRLINKVVTRVLAEG